jgi:hypothetical protein
MEPYIDEFGNLQFKQPANYTGINGINMNQLNIEPYNSMAEMRGQPESRSVLDQGLPFALPNLNYRNYDLSNLFNRNTQPDFINAPQDYYQPMAMRKDLGFDTSYGVANEPDDTQSQEYMDQVQKSKRWWYWWIIKIFSRSCCTRCRIFNEHGWQRFRRF